MAQLIDKLVSLTANDISAITLVAVILTAMATIIYTIGTFMLWFVTRKSTALVRDQLDNQRKQLQSAALSQILSSHRDIFLTIVRDDKLLDAVFAQKNPKDIRLLKKTWMGTILINHCSMMFNEYQRGTLSADSFPNFVDDAKYLFTFPAVADRWVEVRSYHENTFVSFVDLQVLTQNNSSTAPPAKIG